MIISRTPFRVSFFGGGTDYPDWFHEHGGAVLATTIDKYCYISVRFRTATGNFRSQSPGVSTWRTPNLSATAFH